MEGRLGLEVMTEASGSTANNSKDLDLPFGSRS
jgi:hypothetical protein